MRRAIDAPWVHLTFYCSIILWEILTTVLAWWGAIALFRALRAPAEAFNAAKRIPIAALTLSMLMWMVAFLSVGAEWFLMWQSKTWNGQEAAFRMITIEGILLLIMLLPESGE